MSVPWKTSDDCAQVQSDLHQRAKELYPLGQLGDAAQLLSDAIAERPCSELWNDGAAKQTSLGQLADAERGFRMALRLDHGFTLAEAAPLLQQSLNAALEENRSTIETMLL
jgi:Flp pilus assembly protein TadD